MENEKRTRTEDKYNHELLPKQWISVLETMQLHNQKCRLHVGEKIKKMAKTSKDCIKEKTKEN